MMPNIPNELFWHFIRGLFDGDGSISKETKKKLGALRFKIIGSENLINAIKTKFIQFGLSNTKISITKYSSNNNRLVSIHYYSFKDLSLLKQKIYEDSENLRLTRKYELFQTLKEYRHGTYNRTKKLRKLEMYDYLTNKYIKTFNNIHDICNEFNTKPESIYRVIRGNRNHFNGYFFKY